MFQSGAFQSNAFQIGGGEFAPPPPVDDVTQTPAGHKRRERYVARYKGVDHEFRSIDDLEEFIDRARKEQVQTPKKQRKPVRIALTTEFEEEIAPFVEPPRRMWAMPPSAALAQARRIELVLKQTAEDDDEALLWLM